MELCFENIRFYDLRRWKADLTEGARGMNITQQANGVLKYTPIDVEVRDFETLYELWSYSLYRSVELWFFTKPRMVIIR